MRYTISILIFLSLVYPLTAQYDTLRTDEGALTDSLLLEGLDARFVINRYIEAIGGRENLAAVENRTTQMTGSVQGFDVKMTVYQKKPNLLRQVIQASGLDQVIIFDGEKAVLKVGEEKQKIEGNELKKLSYEASMGLILAPDSVGLKFELAGTRMINNVRTYKIVNRIGDIWWNSYYSLDNGLKILEEKEIRTPAGEFRQDVIFSDYREVEGVKYPFKIEQKLGEQELSFKVLSIKVNQNLDDELFEID